jgi:hypothetical protein
MANNRMSVATIDSPEFVNITQMNNSLISKCEIKVLYVGENRNRSYITKEVATKMAQTLPGCPIVGYYIDSKEDFGDHGDQIIIDGEGIKFNKLTKPYGFVAPDSKVWFQKFNDSDEFGNTVVREYLMTEGYLWTGQFEEAKRVIKQGNPQSVELDENSLKGYWSADNNRGVDFFIINDAIFSKLCILGEDVEPCFEGASITVPKVSSAFSKDDDFTKSLFTMMAELKYALNNNKGGLSMENLGTPVVEEEIPTTESVEIFSNEEGNIVETEVPEIKNNTAEFEKKKDSSVDDKKDKTQEDKPEKEDKSTDDSNSAADKKSEDKEEDKEETAENTDDKKKYELLKADFDELQANFASLEEENKKLIAFKQEVENKQKDEMIASFYMLSDEDKEDVIANKAQYTLDDIKAKLSIICVDKRVDFSLGRTSEETVIKATEEAPVVYNLDAHEADTLPAWLKAVENCREKLNK